jgi:ferredoxin
VRIPELRFRQRSLIEICRYPLGRLPKQLNFFCGSPAVPGPRSYRGWMPLPQARLCLSYRTAAYLPSCCYKAQNLKWHTMTSHLNPAIRLRIEQAIRADSTMCWNCSSCDAECPVEIATNRLRPQRIVRFANLGLFEELIASPEIRYCLTCRPCNRVCPNRVKPALGRRRRPALRFRGRAREGFRLPRPRGRMRLIQGE